jgi:hypothetical protein
LRHGVLATIALTIAVSTAQDFSTVQDMEPSGPMCRANGQWYLQGEIACIQPPCMEPRLSRCGMVLNNSAWQKIQDGCPITAAPEDGNTRVAAQVSGSVPTRFQCRQ